jgi:hypothetical protein
LLSAIREVDTQFWMWTVEWRLRMGCSDAGHILKPSIKMYGPR